MVALGFCALNPKLYEKMLRFENAIKGIKSEISSKTLSAGKLQGIFAIIGGLLFLYITLAVVPW